MTALTGKTPAATYKDLLQVSNSNSGIDGTLRDLSDGEGTVGPIKLSTGTIQVPSGKTLDVASGGTFDATGATVTGIGGWELVESQTASASASLDFTTGIDSTYDHYMAVGVDIIPASDAVSLNVEIETGAAFPGADYEYHTDALRTGAAGWVNGANSQSTTAMTMAFGLGTGTGEGLGFELFLRGASGTALYKPLRWNCDHYHSTAQFYHWHGGGTYKGAVTAVTGLQFAMSAGNIASGTIALYGLRP